MYMIMALVVSLDHVRLCQLFLKIHVMEFVLSLHQTGINKLFHEMSYNTSRIDKFYLFNEL